MQESVGDQRAWHQALAYAVVGRRLTGLGTQPEPDVEWLGRWLLDDLGADQIAAALPSGAEHPWPYSVPPDLMRGLGYAQFGAALAQLRRELGLDRAAPVPPRIGAVQPVTASDRRLLDEVPPHHGS